MWVTSPRCARRPLWYQIILREQKSTLPHARRNTFTCSRMCRTRLRSEPGGPFKAVHGRWRGRGRRRGGLGQARLRPRFLSFSRWTRGTFISAIPIRDVKQPGCFRSRDDNVAANTYIRRRTCGEIKEPRCRPWDRTLTAECSPSLGGISFFFFSFFCFPPCLQDSTRRGLMAFLRYSRFDPFRRWC